MPSPDQGVQVQAGPALPLADGVGGEGTVEAGGRAERNSHIEAVSVFIVDMA